MDYKKIKTFEDACTAKGMSATLPDVSAFPEKHRKAILAFFMLTIVIEAINGGWEPNWNDDDEWKYYNWFEVDASKECPAGSGFSISYCDGTRIRVRTSAPGFASKHGSMRNIQQNILKRCTRITF